MKVHTKHITLSQRILFLITFTVFVALLASSMLIAPRINHIFDERIGNNAIDISVLTSRDPTVVEYLKSNKNNSENVVGAIKTIALITDSSIALLDADKNMLVNFTENKDDFDLKMSFLLEDYLQDFNTSDIQRTSYIPYSLQAVYNGDILLGYVAVLFSNDNTASLSTESFILVLMSNTVALVVGALGALFTAKSIKNILWGLEPITIAKMVQEQSAILNTVRDGVISYDISGSITLINKEALKIFRSIGFEEFDFLGRDIRDFFPYDLIKKALDTGLAKYDLSVSLNGTSLMLNILPVAVDNVFMGSIITFRKKNEIEAMAQELTGVRNYADALRANNHEFMNKMHAVLGMIQMEAYDDLRKYIKEISTYRQEEILYVTKHIENQVLAGFIVGKINRAKELDIEFILSDDSYISGTCISTELAHKIILVLGNLITNAFEVLSGVEKEKIVFLTIRTFESELLLIVEDSGLGMSEKQLETIFQKGVSSKGSNRGLGLYLVQQTVEELNGTIEVDSKEGEGTIFTIKLIV